jgi:glycosyltransferase involved in cell wall biosynthesis
MPVATVVLPTHDHGPLLRLSLKSVQEQTVEDLEIFVIGDGVPDETREQVAEVSREDPRVRFFDNPKGPRNGEIHRHAALAEARGEIVCYQSDDDLWLPDHVADLRGLLTAADFAHTIALSVGPDGSVTPLLAALEAGVFRAFMLQGSNFVPLSAAGHTLATYRALPFGWRTTPRPIWTDLYMWQQFLETPGLRFASGSRPGVLNFPSPGRRDWALPDRLTELERWAAFLASADWAEREPAVSMRCTEATVRLRRQLRALEPLAGSARSIRILGKVRRRLGWKVYEREVRSLSSWLAGEFPAQIE